MASARLGSVFRQFERLFTVGNVSGMSEGQLLDRFVTRHDQAAFEAIVARHGPMVLGVCRRLLRNPDDAEDAFQATFLVLVRKAGSLRDRDLLANWLYGVAYRVSIRARAVSARRRTTEASGVEDLADDRAAEPGGGIQPWLREEVFRLPEKYRAPIVLCYLEGLTHDEAADRLRWPVGTVKGRLARARDLLRSRLTRRGLAIGVSTSVVGDFLASDASAAVPPGLVDSTVKAAAMVAAGKAVTAGFLSAGAAALTEGTIQTMFLTKLKTAAALVAAGLLTTTASVLAFQNAGKGENAATEHPQTVAATNPPPPRRMDGPVGFTSEARGYTTRETWEMLLKQFSDPTPHQIDRIAHWSRAVAEAEQYLAAAGGGDVKAAAVRGHLDRMKQLYKITQGLKGPNQSQQADTARGWADDAERMLADTAGNVAREPVLLPNPPSKPVQSSLSNEGGGGLEEDGPIGSKALERLDFRMLARATGTPFPRMGGMGPAPAGPAPAGAGSDESKKYDRKFMTRLDIAQLAADVEAHDTNPTSRTIMKKLEEPIAMSFANETPLEDVLKYIKSATAGPLVNGIPIYVDPIGLADADATLTTPITIDLEGVPLKTTLRLILKQKGLAYCVKDGLLFISSPDGISQELIEFVATHPDDPADDGGSFGGAGTPR